MLVTKRGGEKQAVNLEKIQHKLDTLLFGLNIRYVSSEEVVNRIKEGLYPGVNTFEINHLVAETAASMTTIHPDYSILAGRVCVSALHKSTKDKFSDTVNDLYENYDEYTNMHTPLVSSALHTIANDHRDEIDNAIDYTRDFEFNFFGFKTLEKAYLLCKNGKVAERPQHLIMRVALGIHGDVHSALETYRMMSKKYFTHASPTLFNAGTPSPQMSSCFLVAMREDSIEGIYDTLKDCAKISKRAGGIGLHVHNIRAAGSKISGNNGRSNGLVPMLRVFNNTARYVDQGGNKRPGAFAVYLEPWHADVFEFLDLRKNHGKEEVRARDLFYALWIPDLFMEKVEKDEDWCLFCPKDALGLSDVYGEEFVKLYNKYEKAGRARQVIKAQKLWYAILEAQTETGTPFMLYKDACNRKSNQQNLGTIKSSNLCCEIVQYSSPDEVAVCNLASVALPMFVRTQDSSTWYDFEKLHHIVKVVVRNLNKVIDNNQYPLEEAEVSNRKHRPVAVGVQGLADTFMMLRIPFDSDQARKLNRQIFETIYHAACETSMELSKLHGAYETFQGSPASEGKLQYDLWGVTPSALWNWKELKNKIATYGLRNSLLVAPMPTASTSQILGFNECFEPFTSNIYSRRVLSGEFQVVNPYMMKDLVELGLWSNNMKHRIIADNGSIQNIDGIPDDVKQLYKTVWEISQRVIIDMAADRAPYIDQSQSMNIHLKDCTFGKLTSMHFYGWKKGLKTGMYYLRTQAASAPIQFTVDRELAAATDKLASASRKRTYLEATGTVNSRVNSNATTEPNSPDEANKRNGIANGDIYDQTPLRVCTPSMKDNCETCSG